MCLQYPGYESMFIAMQQVTIRYEYNPGIFRLHNGDNGQLELRGNDAKPSDRWSSDRQFVFLSHPPSREASASAPPTPSASEGRSKALADEPDGHGKKET